jgi:uncharacterized damage-inducible protein DinB
MSIEPWLGGPAGGLTDAELRVRPDGAAPIAFHLVHIAGAIDRLLTYAEGNALNAEQRAALKRETDHEAQATFTVEKALAMVRGAIDFALGNLRAIDATMLPSPRAVGRAQLPTTLGGLLFHAAEHTARHAGQALTTFNIVRGLHALD